MDKLNSSKNDLCSERVSKSYRVVLKDDVSKSVTCKVQDECSVMTEREKAKIELALETHKEGLKLLSM